LRCSGGGIAAVWIDARTATGSLRTEVAQRLAELGRGGQGVTRHGGGGADSLRDAQAKIACSKTASPNRRTQQAALDALYRSLRRRRRVGADRGRAGTVACQPQLQLAGNVSAALAALQLADAKLQR